MCTAARRTIDEVIHRANDSSYGLAAAICSTNLEKVIQVSNSLQAGSVYVNCYDVFDPAAPFGGYKMSGIGRELGSYGLQAYTEVKTVIVKIPQKNS